MGNNPLCRQCGKVNVEDERAIWETPVCYGCVPNMTAKQKAASKLRPGLERALTIIMRAAERHKWRPEELPSQTVNRFVRELLMEIYGCIKGAAK